MEHNCNHCGVELTEDNWRVSARKKRDYKCKSCDCEAVKKNARKLKKEVIMAYGGACVCCGCDIPAFLTIDHIDGKGAEHRRKLFNSGEDRSARSSGTPFYRWLKKNDFPKDNFQLLCYNCNCAKHTNGECPHKQLLEL